MVTSRRQILAKGDHLSSLSGRQRFESLIPDVMWHGELGIYGDDEGKNQKLRMFIEIQNYLIRWLDDVRTSLMRRKEFSEEKYNEQGPY